MFAHQFVGMDELFHLKFVMTGLQIICLFRYLSVSQIVLGMILDGNAKEVTNQTLQFALQFVGIIKSLVQKHVTTDQLKHV